MESINEDLASELEEFSIGAEEKVIDKMRDLCLTYGLSAEDMVSSWVAYSATKNCSSEPNEDLLSLFEQEELNRQSKSSKGKKLSNKSRHFKMPYDSSAEILESPYEMSEQCTPERRKAISSRIFSPNSFSPVPSTPSAKYSTRKASGEAVCKFGAFEVNSWISPTSKTISVSPFDSSIALQNRYAYMFEKLRDYASVLNDRIEDMAICYKESCNVNEWAHIQLPAMDPVPVIGRICSEGGTKLNPQAVFLEGSQETCSGQVLPLDISGLDEYSLFPGQIIAGEGINAIGKRVALKKLYHNSIPPFPECTPDLDNNETLNIVIAAGPFTTSDSLSYEPLADFMKYVKSNIPHICILCGPFVDMKHEEIEKGNLSETYEDIFLGLLRTIVGGLANTHVQIILVPSARDAHHDMVYPTPPYDVKQDFKNVYYASDPCLLNLNGVVFGLTSTDILYHLGKEEIYCSPNPSDRLGRLCEHLLRQRSFYPLYPPNDDVNIDYIHLETHCVLPVSPQILVVPSDLKYFIKDVHGCCCINPERLTKGTVGGTFARLQIGSTQVGSVVNRMQVEIVRI